MLIGITTPEKFYFDEVHYVPAARQMLEPVMPQPMLNPMHPPLAKQIIALSIHSFGDVPLGWRYPAVLFGALAIVAVYLCGLALFAAQGPAIAASLLAFFNQMLFVQSRIAMLDIFALTFGLFATAAFLHGYRQRRPHLWFALAGLACGFSMGCKWSGLFVLAVCIVIVAAVRLMQSWRTQFADGNANDWYRPDLWPGLQSPALRAVLPADPGARLSLDLRSALRPVDPGYPGGAAPDLQRQHHDRNRGPHLYEFVAVLAVPGAPGLVSLRQDRRRPRSRRWSSSAIP